MKRESTTEVNDETPKKGKKAEIYGKSAISMTF
jgi:hypothetical protein